MKKYQSVAFLITGLAFLTVSASSMAYAKDYKMNPSLEKDLINVCKALKSNSKVKLRRAIERSRVSNQAIASKLVCNGMDPVSFAMSENATATADYLAKHSRLGYVQIAKNK